MGNFAGVDLSKLTPEQVQMLEGAGALSIPAVAPAAPQVTVQNTPALTAPPVSAGSTAIAPYAPSSPISTGSKVFSALGEIDQILETGIAGTQVAAGASIAERAIGMGKLVWALFNPHTNATTYHATAAEATAAAVNAMHTKQAHAVATKQAGVNAMITPVLQISAADAATMPAPTQTVRATDPSQNP